MMAIFFNGGALGLSACSTGTKKEPAPPPVPQTPVKMVSEEMYGKEINDPYRNLENLKNKDVEN
jgi:hypothetical protein